MKIALFLNSKYGSKVVFEEGDDGSFWADESCDYVRLSETVDVDFPLLDKQEVMNKQVAAIDRQMQLVRYELEVKINKLEQQKQELLSLPAPE